MVSATATFCREATAKLVLVPRLATRVGGDDMLSRLERKAEALDRACLRALGHPNDHAIQQELLSALEWDESLHPNHAHPVIQELFRQVHDRSTDLWHRIQSAAEHSSHSDLGLDEIHSLRHRLEKLLEVLAMRRNKPPAP